MARTGPSSLTDFQGKARRRLDQKVAYIQKVWTAEEQAAGTMVTYQQKRKLTRNLTSAVPCPSTPTSSDSPSTPSSSGSLSSGCSKRSYRRRTSKVASAIIDLDPTGQRLLFKKKELRQVLGVEGFVPRQVASPVQKPNKPYARKVDGRVAARSWKCRLETLNAFLCRSAWSDTSPYKKHSVKGCPWHFLK